MKVDDINREGISGEEAKRIIDAVLSGNTKAFVKIVEVYKNRIFRYILKNINDYDTAEDLTQETFISVYTNLATFRNNSSLSTWIMAIAVNKLRNYINRSLPRSKKNAGEELLADFRSQESTPQELAEAQEMELLVEEIIASLGDDYRQIYIMIIMEEMPYADVAEVMGIPVGTVKSRMHKVRKILTEKLKIFNKQLV